MKRYEGERDVNEKNGERSNPKGLKRSKRQRQKKKKKKKKKKGKSVESLLLIN